ncbi:MAG: uroporphyrinogen decarboxylase [Chitinophagales bacterium]
MKKHLFLETALGHKTDRKPVWLMRQAGRILPQYRALRAKLSGFKELVKTPELACEVTLQPIDELHVDAAIIFSDILVVCEAMGLNYEMIPKKGPFFPKTVHNAADVAALRVADGTSDIGYTIEAIKLTKAALNNRVPLIGFAACPWTLFAYMVEGQGSKTFSKARKLIYAQPEVAHALMQKITDSTINYLKAQIDAGADLIQIFDSWAGILSPQLYDIFALPYIKQICDAITEVPMTVFAKGAYFAMPQLAELNCEVLGLDWNMNPAKMRTVVGDTKQLQGNLDPCLLYADRKTIEKETIKMLRAFGPKGHIVNLGHGVYPDTPLDSVKCFVDTVQAFEIAKM